MNLNFGVEHMENWKDEMKGMKSKLTEAFTIIYGCIFLFTSLGFISSLLFVPNCAAFPSSYVYTAYLNDKVGHIVLFLSFGLELFILVAFVGKSCWILQYIQMYMLVAPSWIIILRYFSGKYHIDSWSFKYSKANP